MREEGAVEGGNEDAGGGMSTDSGVRVGLPLHSGHAAVGPARRSASDTTTSAFKESLIRFATTVTEIVCTVDSCSHCCTCHLRHNKTGYGRCMRTARQPWPDCVCAGKCPAGRCAQVECAGSIAIINLTHSQSSPTDDRSPAEPVASRPPTPSSPPSGVRREAGGVHVGEELCAGPQAGAHTSQTAAYRQPSATVSDSRSAAGCEVKDVEREEEQASIDSAERSADEAPCSSPVIAPVLSTRQLPQSLLSHLPLLSRQPGRLSVIADGRCSVAAVLLARGTIADTHNTRRDKLVIDSARRRLGQSMQSKWTETEWIQQVPNHLRSAHFQSATQGASQARGSYAVYHELLTKKPADAWLDHCVFYLASAAYSIGVFVIYTLGNGSWYCTHIGKDKEQHIVLYHACGHYECVEYDGRRQFQSDHEFVVQLAQFADEPPPLYPREEDGDLHVLQSLETPCCEFATGATDMARIGTDTEPAAEPVDTSALDLASELGAAPHNQPLPPATEDALRKRAQRAAAWARNERERAKRRARRLAKRDNAPVARLEQTMPELELDTTATRVEGIEDLPELLARVANHGPLYDRVSLHNQPQWRAVNEPLWNAYRLASLTGQRSQLTPILLDILLLPQRVLLKQRRSGRAARRRATAAAGHRFRSEAERLRQQYNCPDPDPSYRQATRMPSDTMANTVAAQSEGVRPRRAASLAAAEAIRQQAADSTDIDTDAEMKTQQKARAGGVPAAAEVDSEDERDEPFPFLVEHKGTRSEDPDSRAARKASHLVQCGLTRKAAQVLHSTAQFADLRTAAAQETMVRLHPRPLTDNDLPALPEHAPLSMLEDDADMRRMLKQSDCMRLVCQIIEITDPTAF